jgi:hypothetical protein
MKKVTIAFLFCFFVLAWQNEVRAYSFVLTSESYGCDANASCGHQGDSYVSGTLYARAGAHDSYSAGGY